VSRARIEINESAVAELLTGPTGPIFRQVENWTTRTTTLAKTRTPVDEGRLRASLQGTVRVEGLRVIGRSGSDVEYARYVHDGTGVFGPRGTPIVPVTAKALVFEPGRMMGPLPRGVRGRVTGAARGENSKWAGLVVTKSVKGSPPNPFLLSALEDVVPFPVNRRGA
jgi:hypothetical protein